MSLLKFLYSELALVPVLSRGGNVHGINYVNKHVHESPPLEVVHSVSLHNDGDDEVTRHDESKDNSCLSQINSSLEGIIGLDGRAKVSVVPSVNF